MTSPGMGTPNGSMGTSSSGMGTPNAMTSGPADEMLDYTALLWPPFNSIDLQRAKSDGYSDSQTARMLKIAKLSHQPFCFVLSRVEEGGTFRGMAEMYGIPLNRLDNVDREQNYIDSYQSAWAATGKAALKRDNAMGSQYRMPGNGGYVMQPASPTM